MQKSLTFITTLIFTTLSCLAGAPQITNEQYAELVNARIKTHQQELGLSEDQVNQFAPIYRNYCDEIAKNARESRKLKKENPANKAEALSEVNRRLSFRIELLQAQKRLAENCSKFLSPEQLVKFPKVEDKINDKMKNHRKKGQKQTSKKR